MNLYAYVGGDPINAIDPWGLVEKYCTEWVYTGDIWTPTGRRTNGFFTRVIQTQQVVESFTKVNIPWKLLERYYLEELERIRRKTRRCYWVDECGVSHESYEGRAEFTNETDWRDRVIDREWVKWNDPRLLPSNPPNPDDRT